MNHAHKSALKESGNQIKKSEVKNILSPQSYFDFPETTFQTGENNVGSIPSKCTIFFKFNNFVDSSYFSFLIFSLSRQYLILWNIGIKSFFPQLTCFSATQSSHTFLMLISRRVYSTTQTRQLASCGPKHTKTFVFSNVKWNKKYHTAQCWYRWSWIWLSKHLRCQRHFDYNWGIN